MNMSRNFDEYIDQLSPKCKMNLSFYKGEDLYSDGDIENTIIDIIANNAPEDYVKAIANEYSWATYYHLTRIRKNILNWYKFDKDASVLEIGCGFGAITGMLCDSCRKVTTVELSKRRATGTLLRCREKENLEIIVGDLTDIDFVEKYDYITLIGVLEYQGKYSDSTDPYGDFLTKIKSLLKPNGKLLIAIENQFGLKYWCGALEDHTGIPFDGINDYALSNKGVRTFSKSALEKMLKEIGFMNNYFYYPMPDYKLPTVIYSENYLPKDGEMLGMKCYYYPGTHTMVAGERKLWEEIIANKSFEFMSNSFLIECAVSSQVGEVEFAALAAERIDEYQVGTRLLKDKTAEKFLLNERCRSKHLKHIEETGHNFTERGLSVVESELISEGIMSMRKIELDTAEDVILKHLRNGNSTEIFALLDKIYDDILKSSDMTDYKDNCIYEYFPNTDISEAKYGPILKTGYIDMNTRNVFIDGDVLNWYDQEWMLENVPAGFVMYRLIITLYQHRYKELSGLISIEELAERYRIVDAFDDYRELDKLFQNIVVDELHLKEASMLYGNVAEDIPETIKRIIKS